MLALAVWAIIAIPIFSLVTSATVVFCVLFGASSHSLDGVTAALVKLGPPLEHVGQAVLATLMDALAAWRFFILSKVGAIYASLRPRALAAGGHAAALVHEGLESVPPALDRAYTKTKEAAIDKAARATAAASDGLGHLGHAAATTKDAAADGLKHLGAAAADTATRAKVAAADGAQRLGHAVAAASGAGQSSSEEK